ncbi:hypothetical protein CSKR_100857 [Clonorchis sinensis]|uniref:Uncharacterized protein n=2 Tax=Clonorchis sinensis TaxID=79923 RepID=G7Y9U4_CLOSI|nr:hypothetical protein CSKR_100857 [Clonorchis sinensis]GAA49728.1 hypothetical protein CLF_103489 [Clonorchis sinensis]
MDHFRLKFGQQKFRSEQDNCVGNTCSVLVDVAKYDGIMPNLDFVAHKRRLQNKPVDLRLFSLARLPNRERITRCVARIANRASKWRPNVNTYEVFTRPIDRLFERLQVVWRVFCGRLFQCNLRFWAPTHDSASDIIVQIRDVSSQVDLFREFTFDVDYTKFNQSANQYHLLS